MDAHDDEFVNDALRAADTKLIDAATNGRVADMKSAIMNGAHINRARDNVFVFTSFYCLVRTKFSLLCCQTRPFACCTVVY